MSWETIRPQHGSINGPTNCRKGWIESSYLRPAAVSFIRLTMDRVEFLTSVSLILTGLRMLDGPRNILTPSGLCDDLQDIACHPGRTLSCKPLRIRKVRAPSHSRPVRGNTFRWNSPSLYSTCKHRGRERSYSSLSSHGTYPR